MPARCAPVRRPLLLLAAVAALAAALLLAVGARPAQAAATITVNTTAGEAVDRKCSLAEAIEAANTDRRVDACRAGSGTDTINIAVSGTITPPRRGFRITSSMTIRGAGTAIRAPRQNHRGSSIEAGNATMVTLAHMKVTNTSQAIAVSDAGSPSLVGYSITLANLSVSDSLLGITVYSRGRGSVLLQDSVVERTEVGVMLWGSSNVAHARPRVTVRNSLIAHSKGLGIWVSLAPLRLVDSTVAHNRGGGVRASGGVIGATVSVEIVNSTIAENGSTPIFTRGLEAVSTTARIENSTIADNRRQARANSGLYAYTSGLYAYSAAISISNSVVANNGGRQCFFDGSSLLIKNTHNASSDSSCRFTYSNINPRLGPLRNNGGSGRIGTNGSRGNVLTMAIDATSPLFNAGPARGCLNRDARGELRPSGSRCDIGAYEARVRGRGSGYVWEDADGDGRRDSNERPFAGVTVSLVNNEGHVALGDTTDARGAYRVEMTPGDWTVRVTDTAGVLSGYRALWSTSLRRTAPTAGSMVFGYDFGYRGSVEVGDLVWEDADGDRRRDADEDPIAGVVVELVDGDDVVRTDTTNARGAYRFYVTPGAWKVRVRAANSALAGHRPTTATSFAVNATAGRATVSNVDFGYRGSIQVGIWCGRTPTATG